MAQTSISILWIFRKYAGVVIREHSYQQNNKLIGYNEKLALLSFLFCITLQAQEKTTTYNISRNGNKIGEMQFYQKMEDGEMFLKISSQVNTRMIFEIDVKTEEGSYYKNGKLMSSYVKRNVNGKEKANKSTQFINSNYKTIAEKKESFFKEPIHYNLMLLYSKEPVNQQKVYSDSFQKFLAIEKIDNHSYRIELPDGNYNDYHFANGICEKVELHHSLYTISIQIA